MYLFSRGMFFIEIFGDFWNYNYHTHSLNIRKVLKKGIAVVKRQSSNGQKAIQYYNFSKIL